MGMQDASVRSRLYATGYVMNVATRLAKGALGQS